MLIYYYGNKPRRAQVN